MGLNKLVRIRVGTDLSRPLGISTIDEDVINRSLQFYPKWASHYPVIFFIIPIFMAVSIM